MTDHRRLYNAATQTLLPKLPGDIFLNSCFIRDWSLKHITNTVEEKRDRSRQMYAVHKAESIAAANSKFCISPFALCHEDRDTEKLRRDNLKRNLLQPTLLSWNFDYGDIDDDNPNMKKFVPYILEANRPWHSLAPLNSVVRGNQVINIGHDSYYWKIVLLSIDELIYETNLLIDMIEGNFSPRQHCYKTLFDTEEPAEFKQNKLFVPSEKWLPLIEKEEKLLADMLKKLRGKCKMHQIQ